MAITYSDGARRWCDNEGWWDEAKAKKAMVRFLRAKSEAESKARLAKQEALRLKQAEETKRKLIDYWESNDPLNVIPVNTLEMRVSKLEAQVAELLDVIRKMQTYGVIAPYTADEFNIGTKRKFREGEA